MVPVPGFEGPAAVPPQIVVEVAVATSAGKDALHLAFAFV